MTHQFWLRLALVVLIPGLTFTTACGKKKIASEADSTTSVVTSEQQPDSDALSEEQAARARQKAEEERRLREERLRAEAARRDREREEADRRAREEELEREQAQSRERFLNEHIYFEFDKSRLLPEARTILASKARWLKDNPSVSFIIEGHCDERGTSQYNMALGDRRARSVQNYLLDLGISRSRMTTISYGEERPLSTRHNEDAWAKNRRAQFVIR